jgi:hypothetical protein
MASAVNAMTVVSVLAQWMRRRRWSRFGIRVTSCTWICRSSSIETSAEGVRGEIGHEAGVVEDM